MKIKIMALSLLVAIIVILYGCVSGNVIKRPRTVTMDISDSKECKPGVLFWKCGSDSACQTKCVDFCKNRGMTYIGHKFWEKVPNSKYACDCTCE